MARFFIPFLVILFFLDCCPTLTAAAIGLKKPAAAAAQAENTDIRDKWALLVGINRFADPAVPSLKFAQKSSADLSRAIKDPEFGHFAQDHVLVLNGPLASKEAIEQAFNDWLFRKALPDDLVIIYFNTRLLKNAGGQAIICANDTQSKEPDKTGINLNELLDNARKRVGSAHMLCLLDTNPCFASVEKTEHDLKWLAKTTGVTVFSAAELFKPSLDDVTDMQSYFCHYFVEALKTGAGNFPLAMLAEYVFQKVQEISKSSSAAAQTPILSLASEQTSTVAIPIGITVRSSSPVKGPHIGHSLDTLAFDRPDMVAPVLKSSKPAINVQSRNSGLSTPLSALAKPDSASPGSCLQTSKKAPAAASAEDTDEDDNVDPNLDLRSYVSKIQEDIQKKWQVPQGLEDRRVVTTFRIMKDGKITNALVAESSGNAAVDESALQALRSASPLWPLPKGSPRFVDLKYVFDWKTRAGSQ